MEHVITTATQHVLGAAVQTGGLALGFALLQVLFLVLFVRLSRVVTSLSRSVGDLAGNISRLATRDDLEKLEAETESAFEKQRREDATLHDRCTGLVNRVARVEGICDTCRRK